MEGAIAMAEDNRATVRVEDVVLSNSYSLAALLEFWKRRAC